MSSFQQNWRKGQNRFCLEARGVGQRGKGWVAGGRNGPMYAHVNKSVKKFIKRFKGCNVTNQNEIIASITINKWYYIWLIAFQNTQLVAH
jgi:hypothetical protein